MGPQGRRGRGLGPVGRGRCRGTRGADPRAEMKEAEVGGLPVCCAAAAETRPGLVLAPGGNKPHTDLKQG